MKRIIAAIIITAVVLLSTPLCALADDAQYSGSMSGNTYYSYNSDSLELTLYGSGSIPDYGVNNMPWFSYRSEIKSIVIKNGITDLGDNLFRYCSSLETVVFADTIKTIGSHTFFYCIKLTYINLPGAITNIGQYAFAGCDTLTSVCFKDMTSNLILDVGVFVACPKLLTAQMPVNTTFGEYSIGFESEDGILQKGFTLKGHVGSNAYYYANGAGIAFSDSVLLNIGAKFGFSFSRYEDSYWYEFTPAVSGKYHFYSTGSVDTMVSVYDASKTSVLAQADDISYQDLNFDVSYDFAAGSTYYFNVSNNHSLGKYQCYLFPNEIKSVTASLPDGFLLNEDTDGEYSMDSNGDIYTWYDMSKYYSSVAIKIVYATGYIDSFYYNKNEYNQSLFSFSDDQQNTHWADGINYITLSYKEFTADIAVNIHVHSYALNRTAPTCTEDGLDVYTCSCGAEYSTVIPALGHNAAEEYVKETCTENGYYFEYCTRCSERLSEITVLYATNHFYRVTEQAAPTLTQEGYTVYTCVNCADSYTLYLDPTGHSVSGQTVVMESPDGSHEQNIGINSGEIYIGRNIYYADENGNFNIILADGTYDIVFKNYYGATRTMSVTVNGSDVDLGKITMVAYDIDQNGYINTLDYYFYYYYIRGNAQGDENYDRNMDFDKNGVCDENDIIGMQKFFLSNPVDSSIYD